MEYYPNSNKVVQFTYQLQNTAPQMVQKQFVGDMVYGCGCEGEQDENSCCFCLFCFACSFKWNKEVLVLSI